MWRFDIINHFIKKFNYKNYLEIGVEDGDNIKLIKCEKITGVDPVSSRASHKQTSDDFFADLAKIENPPKYDIIFIDGLHLEDQVDRDIMNSLKYLEQNGTIVVHDCNPPSEWHQRSYDDAKTNGFRLWNGTVWKSIVKLRSTRPDLSMMVVDTDWGCGIIRNGTQRPLMIDPSEMTYDNLDENRKEWLNLVTPKEFLEIFPN